MSHVFTWGLCFFEDKAPKRKIVTPMRIPSIKLEEDDIISSVSCGGNFSLLCTQKDGHVYSFGSSNDGRLGYPGNGNQTTPKRIPQLKDVDQISAGVWHCVCKTRNNQVYTWGKTIDTQMSPTLVSIAGNNDRIVKVDAGYGYSGALTESGKLYLWGKGSTGKMGFGPNVTAVPVPTELVEYSVHDFSLGYDNTIFCTIDGKVYTMGSNNYYQLGIGKDKNKKETPQLVPLPYNSNDKIIQVSASVGSPHNCHAGAVTQSGLVYLWGNSYKFKLGTGDLTDQPLPVRVTFFDTIPIQKLVCGGIHNYALAKNGTVYSWGCGSDGRLGHPESEGHRYLYKEEEPRAIQFPAAGRIKELSTSYYHGMALME